MKSRTKELDVDFIGEQNHPLTKREQHAISDFIRQLKEKRNKKILTKTRKQSLKRKKRTVDKSLA